jgi:hypothetical protein
MCGTEELVQQDWDDYCMDVLELLNAAPTQYPRERGRLQQMLLEAAQKRMVELKHLRSKAAE